MPSQSTTTFSSTELAYLHTSLSLSPPTRPDARAVTTFRPLIAETDLIPSANGSARLCFADGTEGIVGVKADVEKSSARNGMQEIAPIYNISSDDQRPLQLTKHDCVEVTIDIPGQRDDDSTIISLCQMIQESLTTDHLLRSRLYINEHWHWKLYIDILLLSQPLSYPLPLLSLSTHLALLSTRLPALISQDDEDPLFNDDWAAALPLYQLQPTQKASGKQRQGAESQTGGREVVGKPPVHLLVISVGENIFFDPSPEELAVADAVVVATLAQLGGEKGVELLGIRTLDPPARGAASSFAAAAQQGAQDEDGEVAGEGVWRPKVGGMKRTVLSKMVEICVQEGGVGEEVLTGLEGFV